MIATGGGGGGALGVVGVVLRYMIALGVSGWLATNRFSLPPNQPTNQPPCFKDIYGFKVARLVFENLRIGECPEAREWLWAPHWPMADLSV